MSIRWTEPPTGVGSRGRCRSCRASRTGRLCRPCRAYPHPRCFHVPHSNRVGPARRRGHSAAGRLCQRAVLWASRVCGPPGLRRALLPEHVGRSAGRCRALIPMTSRVSPTREPGSFPHSRVGLTLRARPFLPTLRHRSVPPPLPARSTSRALPLKNPRSYFGGGSPPAFGRSFSGLDFPKSITNGIHGPARHSRGTRMAWRTLLERLDVCWSAACVWFLRRSPLPPNCSLRLLTRLSAITGLPRPCPIRAR